MIETVPVNIYSNDSPVEVVDLTNANLVELVKGAYSLSVPLGMGFLHYRPGGLTEEEAQSLVNPDPNARYAVAMDYVRGRAVKMSVWNVPDNAAHNPQGIKRFTMPYWYDHTQEEFELLLATCLETE